MVDMSLTTPLPKNKFFDPLTMYTYSVEILKLIFPKVNSHHTYY